MYWCRPAIRILHAVAAEEFMDVLVFLGYRLRLQVDDRLYEIGSKWAFCAISFYSLILTYHIISCLLFVRQWSEFRWLAKHEIDVASAVQLTHLNSVLGLFRKYFNSFPQGFSRHDTRITCCDLVLTWSHAWSTDCCSARSDSTQEYLYSNENSNRGPRAAGQLKWDKYQRT